MAAANRAASKADKEVYIKTNIFSHWKHLPEITLSVYTIKYISQNAAACGLFKVKCGLSVV
jgi:hypothetical protein